MPVDLLTEAERERWQRFPDTMPQDDLVVFVLLSEEDRRETPRQRAPQNRLGSALQLCILRYLGFVPDDLQATPHEVVAFVAEQREIDPRVLTVYASRRRTQTDHQLHVQTSLKFRRATPLDFYALHTWLIDRALDHDKPTLLLQLAGEKLSREKMVRPGVTRLERRVATVREQAHDATFRRLTPLLTDERKAFLDGLLTPDPQTGRTLLSWVRQAAVSHGASQSIATLQKIVVLHETGVHQWDRDSRNPNRATWLAQIGWKSTNQHLQRLPPLRRSPVLVAFLPQALLHHPDVAVELFDQCLWGCHSEAHDELEAFHKALARATNDKLTLCRELGRVLLDDAIEDPDVRAVSFERVPTKVLQEAIDEPQSLIRPRPDDAIDFFGKRYRSLRQFVPFFLHPLT